MLSDPERLLACLERSRPGLHVMPAAICYRYVVPSGTADLAAHARLLIDRVDAKERPTPTDHWVYGACVQFLLERRLAGGAG